MPSSNPRLALNAPGSFYTTGDCMACGAPEAEAPELLAPLEADNFQTYFLRQPQTPEEVEHACSAIQVCCVEALRYGGTDASIIRRLGNRRQYCDHLLPGGPVRLQWDSDEQWRWLRRTHRRWWQFWLR